MCPENTSRWPQGPQTLLLGIATSGPEPSSVPREFLEGLVMGLECAFLCTLKHNQGAKTALSVSDSLCNQYIWSKL